jgi:hypothetical protein
MQREIVEILLQLDFFADSCHKDTSWTYSRERTGWYTEVRKGMGEHKQNPGVSAKKNNQHGVRSQRAGQQRPTLDNAAKRLIMSVLVVMCGALVSMVQGARTVGYIIVGVGLAWYLFLRLIPLWHSRHAKHGK